MASWQLLRSLSSIFFSARRGDPDDPRVWERAVQSLASCLQGQDKSWADVSMTEPLNQWVDTKKRLLCCRQGFWRRKEDREESERQPKREKKQTWDSLIAWSVWAYIYVSTKEHRSSCAAFLECETSQSELVGSCDGSSKQR